MRDDTERFNVVLTCDAVEADEAANVIGIELDKTCCVRGGPRAKSCRLGALKQADLRDIICIVVDGGSRELTLSDHRHVCAIESLFDRLWAYITHRYWA